MSARQQLSRAAEFALLFLIAPIALWWVGWAGGEVPVVPILVLLGGLALFLYGMEKMTDGLKAAAGTQMNTLLAKLTGNRILGAVTGAIVTAVIQSSSVTTVTV